MSTLYLRVQKSAIFIFFYFNFVFLYLCIDFFGRKESGMYFEVDVIFLIANWF